MHRQWLYNRYNRLIAKKGIWSLKTSPTGSNTILSTTQDIEAGSTWSVCSGASKTSVVLSHAVANTLIFPCRFVPGGASLMLNLNESGSLGRLL